MKSWCRKYWLILLFSPLVVAWLGLNILNWRPKAQIGPMVAPGAHWVIYLRPVDSYAIGSIPEDELTDKEPYMKENGRFNDRLFDFETEHMLRIIHYHEGEKNVDLTYNLDKKTTITHENRWAYETVNGYGWGTSPHEKGRPFFKVHWDGELKTISYHRFVGFPVPTKWKKISYEVFTGNIRIINRRTGQELGHIKVKNVSLDNFPLQFYTSHTTGRFVLYQCMADPVNPKLYVFREEKPAQLPPLRY